MRIVRVSEPGSDEPVEDAEIEEREDEEDKKRNFRDLHSVLLSRFKYVPKDIL